MSQNTQSYHLRNVRFIQKSACSHESPVHKCWKCCWFELLWCVRICRTSFRCRRREICVQAAVLGYSHRSLPLVGCQTLYLSPLWLPLHSPVYH